MKIYIDNSIFVNEFQVGPQKGLPEICIAVSNFKNLFFDRTKAKKISLSNSRIFALSLLGTVCDDFFAFNNEIVYFEAANNRWKESSFGYKQIDIKRFDNRGRKRVFSATEREEVCSDINLFQRLGDQQHYEKDYDYRLLKTIEFMKQNTNISWNKESHNEILRMETILSNRGKFSKLTLRAVGGILTPRTWTAT